ncbi:MAG: LysR family transcriptional regulator [Thiolinea sp.]
MQIRQLEEDTGLALFERRGRSMVLTPAGRSCRNTAVRWCMPMRICSGRLMNCVR